MTSFHHNNEQLAGLVNSDITCRDQLFKPDLVTREALENSASLLPTSLSSSLSKQWHVQFSPASVTVKAKLPTSTKPKSVKYRKRSEITKWSKKSRSSMIARLASLDFIPMLNQPNSIPIMVTLTYPKNWLQLTPDAATAKKHLQAFKKRYERRFDQPLYGLWKLEFQRRKSPHFHLFCVPPVSLGDFKKWLSLAWVEIVNEPDPAERQKHLKAGTGVDVVTGLRSTNAKLISVYFSKHSSPGSSPKEYQNQPPDEWVTNGSVGRFWGYWHLQTLSVQTPVDEEVAFFVARTLRRLNRAHSSAKTVFVWRTNQRTGEVKKRKVKRRTKRFKHTSGYMVVADGAVTGEAIANAVRARFNVQ